MSPKLHPDDVPRELGDLSKYLKEVYSIDASAWVLADMAREKLVPATKIRGRWRTTATAYLQAMSPEMLCKDCGRHLTDESAASICGERKAG